MKQLYELTNEYKKLFHEINESDEITEEQILYLRELNLSINDKIINISYVIKNLEVESNGIDDAISSMTDRSIRVNRKINRLKEYVKTNMIESDIKEIKNPYFDIKLRISREAVDTYNESLIPEKYVKEIKMLRIDKSMIKEDIKNGVEVPGAKLKRETNLHIK